MTSAADDTLDRIDQALTYWSEGLGEEVTVSVPGWDWDDHGSTEPESNAMLPTRVVIGDVDVTSSVRAVELGWARALVPVDAMERLSFRLTAATVQFTLTTTVMRSLSTKLDRLFGLEKRRLRLRRMRHLYRQRRRARW